MRQITSIPCKVHILVCANARPPGGLPACGEGGTQLFDALKQYVLNRGLSRVVWVTETRCLGYCHAKGTTLAIYWPGSGKDPLFVQSVQPTDLAELIDQHIKPALQVG